MAKTITIVASGSRGDVQPSIALAVGFSKAGYQVRVVTHENYRDLLPEAGIDFFPVAGNIQDIAQGSAFRDLREFTRANH